MTSRVRSPTIVIAALLFTTVTLAVGYWAFGFVTTLIFTSGFLGGLLLWLVVPTRASWNDVRRPFWIAFALFVVHRIEENRTGFFERLAEITREPTPEIVSAPVILLVTLSVGAWLAAPFLAARSNAFGFYLAWTFFAAMGITELAHFVVFPFIDGEPLGYFPGMASVVLLAPVAWFGMVRLAQGRQTS